MGESLRVSISPVVYYLVINVRSYVSLFLYSAVLAFYKDKRDRYPTRLLLCILAAAALLLPLSFFRIVFGELFGTIVCNGTISLLLLFTLFVCYRENISELLFLWMEIVATRGLSENLFSLLLACFGKNSRETISFFSDRVLVRDWLVNIGFHALILIVVHLFLHQGSKIPDDRRIRQNAVFLTIATFLLSSPLYSVILTYHSSSSILAFGCRVLYISIYAFILNIRVRLLENSTVSTELQVTRQLLAAEKKHYAELKGNIELINMKCHDINRQLSTFQGKLTDQELLSLQEAVNIYDAAIRTGSEVLDSVLYQKSLYCKANHINLSFMADGQLLSFLSVSDLYALLSNALENAVEAVMALCEEKRVIGLSVQRVDHAAVIEVTNYFDGTIAVSSGTILSKKTDRSRHGYGLMSMRYIAEKYGGSLDIRMEKDLFFLTVSLPLPVEASETSK